MELEYALCVGIDDNFREECILRAERFNPCLNTFSSKGGSIIDVYIKNVTSERFYLTKSDLTIFSGPAGKAESGVWIIPPPKRIKSGETVFMRAYSGKISTTDPLICIFPVEMDVDVAYKSCDSGFSFSVISDRETEENGCEGLQPFKPINVTEFGLMAVVSPSSDPGSYQRKDEVLNILYLQPSPEDDRWRNTAYFIIS